MGYEDNRQSKFNAGVALAERIDALQRANNAARFNPLLQNPETGTFNYENMITATDALMHEAWGKLTDKEKKHCLHLMEVVHNYKKFCPPTKIGRDGTIQINKVNYEKLIGLIDFYERKAKELLDKHSLNSPDYDDSEGW